MKNLGWLIQTELKQNKFHFVLAACISLLLGVSASLTMSANQRIAALVIPVQWHADLVVVPKGISLRDFERELLNGESSAFLPEALFDTTVGLAKGQFSLTAVLAIHDSSGPHLQIKSNGDPIGVNWLKGRTRIENWSDQNIYETPEWGHKLITGFIAAGSFQEMEELKKLINSKTVAQAIVLSEQQSRDEENQSELQTALYIYTGILVSLIVLSLSSLFLWVRVRLSNTLLVLDESGFEKQAMILLIVGLIVIVNVAPMFIGVILGNGITSL